MSDPLNNWFNPSSPGEAKEGLDRLYARLDSSIEVPVDGVNRTGWRWREVIPQAGGKWQLVDGFRSGDENGGIAFEAAPVLRAKVGDIAELIPGRGCPSSTTETDWNFEYFFFPPTFPADVIDDEDEPGGDLVVKESDDDPIVDPTSTLTFDSTYFEVSDEGDDEALVTLRPESLADATNVVTSYSNGDTLNSSTRGVLHFIDGYGSKVAVTDDPVGSGIGAETEINLRTVLDAFVGTTGATGYDQFGNGTPIPGYPDDWVDAGSPSILLQDPGTYLIIGGLAAKGKLADDVTEAAIDFRLYRGFDGSLYDFASGGAITFVGPGGTNNVRTWHAVMFTAIVTTTDSGVGLQTQYRVHNAASDFADLMIGQIDSYATKPIALRLA